MSERKLYVCMLVPLHHCTVSPKTAPFFTLSPSHVWDMCIMLKFLWLCNRHTTHVYPMSMYCVYTNAYMCILDVHGCHSHLRSTVPGVVLYITLEATS